jgi:hypothetical protein
MPMPMPVVAMPVVVMVVVVTTSGSWVLRCVPGLSMMVVVVMVMAVLVEWNLNVWFGNRWLIRFK